MPTVMSLIDRNDAGAFKKGPAIDASMITRMKRQHAITLDLLSNQSTNGRKGTGLIVDGQHIRGFQDNGVRTGLIKFGANMGFFRVN
jgi:hypothetical protein